MKQKSRAVTDYKSAMKRKIENCPWKFIFYEFSPPPVSSIVVIAFLDLLGMASCCDNNFPRINKLSFVYL